MKNWGGVLAFVLGSVVAGLALAFLLVMLAPQLLRPPPAASPPVAAAPDTPVSAPARVTYADAVQRAAPSVVNIYTARLVTERVAPSALEQMFGNYWPRYQQRVERSLGSGVIVDAQGHIVTNNHVIVNAESINVQLADGRTTDARVVGRDPDTDLAVLAVDLKSPVPVAPFGRSDRLKVGDVVLAIGNPIGLSQTVTHGIVSATGRQQLGLAYFEDFIQTDAAINAGNSGGALVDSSGALVGINTAIIAKSLGVEGIGFAIPVNMVRGVLDDILSKGRVVRGWIGIVPQDITEEQAAQFGLARAGVLLTNLFRDSPALKAGLQPGDMLLDVDGTALHSAQDAITRVAAHRPGTTVALRALRGSKPIVVQAQVVERPRNQ
jgi:Do/DeqQ family serine protease